MDLIVHEKQQKRRLWINDHGGKQAMKNAFQTPFFQCTLQQIELCGSQLAQYEVDEDVQFLKMHITLYNPSDETITIYSEDFSILFDRNGPFMPEEAFGAKQQFPDVIKLMGQATQTGCFIFLIAKHTKQIVFSYREYNEEGEEGKRYRLRYTWNPITV